MRRPEDVIALLETGEVTELSLDHDLGAGAARNSPSASPAWWRVGLEAVGDEPIRSPTRPSRGPPGVAIRSREDWHLVLG